MHTADPLLSATFQQQLPATTAATSDTEGNRFQRMKLINWLIDWLTDWLIDWLIACMIDWLIDWLNDWLIDWLIDWRMVYTAPQFYQKRSQNWIHTTRYLTLFLFTFYFTDIFWLSIKMLNPKEKNGCHILSNSSHNGHLSTMTIFLCPQGGGCEEVPQYSVLRD